MASSSELNNFYKSTLGRSIDKSGLDHYSKIAKDQGMDAVKSMISGSNEAKEYQSSQSARNVSSNDRVSSVKYRRPASNSSSSSGSSSSAQSSGDSKYDFGFGVNGQTWKDDPDYKSWMNTPNQLVDVKKRNLSPGSVDQQRQAAEYVASRARGDGPSNAMRMSIADKNKAMEMAGVSDYQDFNNMLADYGVLGSQNEFVGNVGQGSGRVFGGGSSTGGSSGNSGGNTSGGGLLGRSQNSSTSAADQLNQMLASDSPLMQRSASQGMQAANSRGLLNSSMAAEAAQGAMIDRATPLAQQDAQFGQNMAMNEQQFGFDMGRMQQEYGFNSQLSTQEAQQSLERLQATSTANGWGVMANNMTDIIGQYSSQLERIQMNPDIQEADKASMIEQVLDMRDADIDFQRSVYDQLPDYLANTGVFPDLT